MDSIQLLVEDVTLRKKIGINAREHVLKNYSTAVIERLYLSALGDKYA
jgi:hypothetical protein